MSLQLMNIVDCGTRIRSMYAHLVCAYTMYQHAIFNTIYEITIKNDALDKSVRNNLHDLQGKLSHNVIWEVWNYSIMGKFRLIT